MKIDLVITDPVGKWLKLHKYGKKCVGRFFTLHPDIESIDMGSLTDFDNRNYLGQEMFITSFCQKCCNDIIQKLLDRAKPEAKQNAVQWFKSQRKIKFFK